MVGPLSATRRTTRALLAAVSAIGVSAALIAAPSASATLSCTVNGSTLEVAFDEGPAADFPQLDVTDNPNPGTIHISDFTPPTQVDVCGTTHTVNTIDRVEIENTVAGQDNQAGITANNPIGPGATLEPNGISEIEVEVNLGDGFDSLSLIGAINPPGANHFRIGELAGGAAGVNLNAPESGGADGDDVALHNVESMSVSTGGFFPGELSQTIDLSGTAEFIGPAPLFGNFAGGTGNDTFITGTSNAFAEGFDGDDLFVSGPGNDHFRGDSSGGEQGTDTVSYERAPSAVTIDLAVESQPVGGGGSDFLGQLDIEGVIGSAFDDQLRGSDVANEIAGGEGADVVEAGDGNDEIDVSDADAGDTVDCGPGTDAVSADSLDGVPEDTIDATTCEDIQLVDRTTPGSGGGGGDGGGGGGGARDVDPPETTITKAPKGPSAKPSATLRFASDEPNSTFVCKLDRKPSKPCTSPRKLKKLKPGKHRFLVTATDAAGNPDPTPAKARFRTVDRD